MNEQRDPWLTEREAAKELRVSPSVVRSERIAGKLGFARIRRRVFYPLSLINAYKQQAVTLPTALMPDHGANRDSGSITQRAREAARRVIQRASEKPATPAKASTKRSPSVITSLSPKEMLDRYGLVDEQAFATMIGIGVHALRNRARVDQPQFVKVGRKRFFVEESVREFLASRRDQKGR